MEDVRSAASDEEGGATDGHLLGIDCEVETQMEAATGRRSLPPLESC